MQTFFQDFMRDNGLPVTVEYSANGGEPNFDHPGHICDGGGSGPEVCIVDSWPNTAAFERLCGIRNDLDWGPRAAWRRPFAWITLQFVEIAVWACQLTARLTTTERERMEAWIAEHHVYEPYEPEDCY